MKNITILGTGGTIASSGRPGAVSEYTVAFSAADLTAGVPGLERFACVTAEQCFNVKSPDLTRAHWLTLARRVNELASDGGVDGIVVTHGTDTMEETAYFLHLTAHTDKPIVLTGAMRPPTATSPDGAMNLYQAVRVAACDESRGKGVLVTFADAIYGAREVQKVISSNLDAFGGRTFGCLGVVHGSEVFFVQQSVKRHTARSEFDVTGLEKLPHVPVFYISPDEDPAALDWYAHNADGLVLAGMGGGSLSDRLADHLRELTDAGLIAVRSTRCLDGVTFWQDQQDARGGTIPSLTLPPPKARVLLALALTRTRDKTEIARMFAEY